MPNTSGGSESTFPNTAAAEAFVEISTRLYTGYFEGRERAATAHTGDERTADDLQPHDQCAPEHEPERTDMRTWEGRTAMHREWLSEAGYRLVLQHRSTGRCFVWLFDREGIALLAHEFEYHQQGQAEREALSLARLGRMREASRCDA